jgi:L-fucose isomerase-like protein
MKMSNTSPAWSKGDEPVNPAQEPLTLEEQIRLYQEVKRFAKDWTEEDDMDFWNGEKPAGADD